MQLESYWSPTTYRSLILRDSAEFRWRRRADALARCRPRARVLLSSRRKFQQLKEYTEMYDNRLINALMTFIEPCPIGLVITLISAAVLKRKPQSQPAQTPLPAD